MPTSALFSPFLSFTLFLPLSLFTPDNPEQASQSAVSIRILDVNDNPPELATPYEASICEDAKPGQVGYQLHHSQSIAHSGPSNFHPFMSSLSQRNHLIIWIMTHNWFIRNEFK